jgi:hypothetical protein
MLALLVQIFIKRYVKKSLFGEKSARCYAHCYKIVNVFANNSETGRDISKIPTDLDSAGQK